MGAWGWGNFDDDGALDFLAEEVQQPLLNRVKAVLDDPRLAEADEPDSSCIMAAVELLALLSEHTPAVAPPKDEVETWRAAFLQGWSRTAHEVYESAEGAGERRAVIEATFDRLIRAAEANGGG